MALLVVAMSFIPLMDAFGKLLSTRHDIAPASVALGRFGVQIVWLLLTFGGLALARRGSVRLRRQAVLAPSLRPSRIDVHLLRGALHGSASLLFFVAVTYMPLADAIAVFFVEPMILIALSALFLREQVGWPRRVAAVVGFGGALLVIQPSYALFGPVSLLPLATATLFACYLLVTRRFSVDDHPLTMQLWSGTGATATTLAFIAVGEVVGAGDYQFTLPSTSTAVWLFLGIGAISAFAHIVIVIAFSLAEASVLAPFNYLEIVTATFFGFVVFDDFPGSLQWVGIAVIVATGLFIFFRERKLEADSLAAIRPGAAST